MTMEMEKVEMNIQKYTMEDIYKVVDKIKGELPMEINILKNGVIEEVDLLEITDTGWVSYKNVSIDEEASKKLKPSKMRIRELVSELKENNSYLLDYVLVKKQ